MNDSLDLFFQEQSPVISEDSPVWRPPSFPPPDDFYVTVDGDGKPLSKYGDDYWSFKAFGWEGFNFAKQELSPENLSLVKRVTFFLLYHPRLFPGSSLMLAPVKIRCYLPQFKNGDKTTFIAIFQ
jgi:hypothetical protein